MRTTVDLTWIEGRVERWIRFGRITEEIIITRTDKRVAFDPGAIFALVRWSSNEYGTVESRFDILRAVKEGQPCSTIPYVSPGGDVLLRLSGWPKVEAALLAVDIVESYGIAPEDVCPDHWRHVHNRLSAGYEPRPYTPARHAAWLKRRAVAS
ncbi:glycosidase [Jannaschia sp. EhC01]|nr:glycosidase [Jannaschia sp. EhC01]